MIELKLDLEKAQKEFIKYTEKYDLKNQNIKGKQLHSLRVMEISKRIAEMLNLSEEKIQIATLIGLLHDIGRFEQYIRFKYYGVIKEFDHGDYAVQILKNDIRKYIEDERYDSIIFKAIKNHNKYKIEDELNEQEEIFAKLIRDADKIDILFECENIFWKCKEKDIENSILSDEIYEKFKKKELIKIEKNRKYNNIDDLFITFAYTFDVNYNVSYKIIKDNNYINNTIKRFNFKNQETNEKIEELIKILNEYIENMEKG